MKGQHTFEEYKTGLRQLFEVVRYSGEKEKLKKIMEENRETYSHIDSDTRELIEVVGKVRIEEEYGDMREDGKREYNMCKAFLDMKLEGVEEGRSEGRLEGRLEYLIETVCKKLLKDKPAPVIAEELEEELPTVENIMRIQQKLGTYDIRQIYEALQAEQAGEPECAVAAR